MSETRVERATNKGKNIYDLFVVEHKMSEERPIEPTLLPLMEKYKDVFLNDLPPGLPPLRGIEYQIDLIPGALLPNKAAYRCNPEETKELQRQIR